MTHLAIFASGAGSNADNIIQYFKDHTNIKVSMIVCNVPLAGVFNVAEKHKIPIVLIDKATLYSQEQFLSILNGYQIDRIILAGFLWLIPAYLIQKYKDKIVNIHPSLLPKYGGKGMYGMKVHQAVIDQKEEHTGITIHVVDEIYDNGRILLQKTTVVEPNDTPHDVAKKVHELEYACFPKVIEEWIEYKG
ncbi:MAG TPA: phosphoribosylglycinamide formyltransferase [Saprospiraceae bacterium]|nr:phosphoribosylglycinamide formyltransferase [Saprospiraceae bacterium]